MCMQQRFYYPAYSSSEAFFVCHAMRVCFGGSALGVLAIMPKIPDFGWNSNEKVRFGFFRPEYSGSPLEVVHLFRLEYSDRNSPFHF